MSREKVHRNDPCPCGSGKKSKRCCGGKIDSAGGKKTYAWVAAGLVLVGLVGWGLKQGSNPSQMGFTAPTRTGQPWEFDAETNTHWDPTHRHWHQGPVPANRPTEAGAPQPTPKPWEYNPATNQYWDPNHRHWHDGRPPAQ